MALHLPAHTLSDEPESPVLHVHLNADRTLFGTSTREGWIIYRTNPLEALIRKDLSEASLSICLPLERTNLVFLVGGPPSPLYPPNQVVLYDAQADRAVAELDFREEVRGLAARRDRLFVALRRRVVIFVLGEGQTGLWREGTYQTADNSRGLVAVASQSGSTLLACPGRQPGQVQLIKLPPLDPSMPSLPPPPSHDPTASPYPVVSVVLAHSSGLAALSITPDGGLLATASKQGTLVRVWDTQSGHLVKELRRGTDTAEIFSLALRSDGGAVAVSSDKGTVHVWDLRRKKADKDQGPDSGASTPRQRQLSMLKPYLPKYFSSEWSHSQFRLPPPGPASSRLPFSLSTPSHSSSQSSTAPTIEDDICTCAWIDLPRRADPAPTGAGTGPSELSDLSESQLVVITRSGGWFRIAFDAVDSDSGTTAIAASAPASDRKGKGKASEGRAAPPKEGVIGLDKDSTSDCRVAEYQRYGQKDDW